MRSYQRAFQPVELKSLGWLLSRASSVTQIVRTDRGLERSVMLPWHVCVYVSAAIESGVMCVVVCESSALFVPISVFHTARQTRAKLYSSHDHVSAGSPLWKNLISRVLQLASAN